MAGSDVLQIQSLGLPGCLIQCTSNLTLVYNVYFYTNQGGASQTCPTNQRSDHKKNPPVGGAELSSVIYLNRKPGGQGTQRARPGHTTFIGSPA